MSELKETIIESAHILIHKNFNNKKTVAPVDVRQQNQSQIQIVEKKDSRQYFYLIKKGEKFDSNTKYSYINYLEKSFNLIHPSIINLSGYSIEKPYLYYIFDHEPFNIDFPQISIENLQKIFIGVASGLLYLLNNGYFYSNFSINSIIFDNNFCPKLIDYINFEDKTKPDEANSIVVNYVDFIKKILRMKFPNEKKIKNFNQKLRALIEQCDLTKTPTLEDFIELFKTQPFIDKCDMKIWSDFHDYFDTFKFIDTLIYDDSFEMTIIYNYHKIEELCSYVYHFKQTEVLDEYVCFTLNYLPEYYIKPLTKSVISLYKKLNRFLYNENISLILPNWNKILNLNSFQIYKKIMKKMEILETQKKDMFFCNDKIKEMDYRIESLRNQAIRFLIRASKEQPQEIQIKIELAVQYVKGYLFEYSLEKALNTLESIPVSINNSLANQMKRKIQTTIKSTSIKNILHDYPEVISQEKIEKAEKGDVLSMLYLGFAFYTKYDGYPCLRSLSHYYYEKAANQSPYAMLLLGYFYYKGIIFPQNLNKAQECFKKSAQNGCLKAEIIDSVLRKHAWRSYLVDFDLDEIFNNFIQSFDLSNVLSFSKIYYNLESNLQNGKLYKLILVESDDDLISNFKGKRMRKKCKNLRMIECNALPVNIKHGYSQKVLLSSENFENIKDPEKQLNVAKSYFYGENGFPVNYTKAAQFFKLSADNGNSEAQWRYGLLIINKIVFAPNDTAEYYLKRSANQNNIKGKFYYSIYLKNTNKDISLFDKLIKECCDAGDAESLYFYGMYLEESIRKAEFQREEESKFDDDENENENNDNKESKKKPIKIDESIDEFYSRYKPAIDYYEKAANQGHFDALNRLINLVKTESHEEYMPIGLMNDNFLSKLIEFYDKNENYTNSNALIQIGLIKNPKLFNFYYCDHLINEKGIENDPNVGIAPSLEKANKLAILAFQNNYPDEYKAKYIYIILQILIINNDHEKALNFLLKYKFLLSKKNKEYFHSFYKKFDKRIARDNYIPACFYRKQFRCCHLLFFSDMNLLSIFGKLIEYATEDEEFDDKYRCNNPFAMAILGKIYKQEKKGLLRNLDLAVKYFARSAKYNCPLGCYYLGKEYYYGRYLPINKKKAKMYLLLAIENNEEPRAGFYLYKLTNDLDMLKIGVEYGHNRALYEYGKMLYKNKETRDQAILYMRQACSQKFKKANAFCFKHRILFIDILETYSKKKTKINKKKTKNKNDSSKSNDNNAETSTGFTIDIPEENEFTIDYDDNNNNNNEIYLDNDNDNGDSNDESISSLCIDFWK